MVNKILKKQKKKRRKKTVYLLGYNLEENSQSLLSLRSKFFQPACENEVGCGYKETNKQTNKKTNKQTSKQTKKQTNKTTT
jgi:hypothetical protein